ncbi:type II toxin-antitoxin system VapC family toxin [Caldilinea sp.]|jgi:tRNA(fMet)-specific endonuclease VapC|uniref:type II toxin-antitoxin system VapC family toxin n=1 Tax=Caldilinea sp. TaxID=2293560 RepID=UPI0021DD4E8C|nr:type II toxin-antitoxin system VapC family toxin [Caldilinea sp.]GIV69499.1 MAG: hypothetical protein KatS3mg048_2361 [Caldilinea sp.]
MLDTSAYSAFRRGHPSILETIQKADTILISSIVVGELLFGFQLGSHYERNRRELDDFISSPRVQVVPIDLSTAERYAWLFVYLRNAGKPVPINDLWIAASAWEHGCVLLTTDRHFSEMPQIPVNLVQ